VRILVTGVKGQLGYDVVNELTARGIDCRGVDIDDFDLTKRDQVLSYIQLYAPTAVIHCAAFTAVDRAEEDRELCFAVNVDGTNYVAQACQSINAKMMYISTDYVFSGEGVEPFEVDSPKEPGGYYGLTKSLGEDKVMNTLQKFFIVRTSWVFGLNGNNFVRTMVRLGKEREQLNVVSDQIGSPTYTADLAILLSDMITTEKFGVYHATNEGICSWYDFAAAIMTEAGITCKVLPITSEQFPSKVKRPKNSRLSKASLDQAGFSRLPDWQDALMRFLQKVL
jgi:dTDP-4-dehydrorhamnose reductase